jgi:hypothetical protein
MRIGDLCAKDEYLKIYDPSKQELIKECDTYVDAEIYTGIQAKILRNAVRYKTRRFSPFLDKEIAVRVGIRKGSS